MKEIKFRGLDKYGVWHYGYVWEAPTKQNEFYIKEYLPNTNSWADFEVRKETIGQYTGFKDKNEKEIYEKDIVKRQIMCYGHKAGIDKRVVAWITTEKSTKTFSGCGFNIFDAKDFHRKQAFEIIGNIYENHDLVSNPDIVKG